jgi:hypothetical protein
LVKGAEFHWSHIVNIDYSAVRKLTLIGSRSNVMEEDPQGSSHHNKPARTDARRHISATGRRANPDRLADQGSEMKALAEEALRCKGPRPDNELIVLPQPKAEEEQPLLF